MSTSLASAATVIHAAALQNYPTVVTVAYAIVSCNGIMSSCPVSIDAETGALLVDRSLNGEFDSGTTLVVEARDSRANCTLSGVSVTEGGCSTVNTVTLQIAYFTNWPDDVYEFVTEPGAMAIATWRLPTLNAAVAGLIPLISTKTSGSWFDYGVTTVLYNGTGFTGSASITFSFNVIVQVGFSIEVASVVHFFRAPNSKDPKGTATDYLVDSTRTFGKLFRALWNNVQAKN